MTSKYLLVIFLILLMSLFLGLMFSKQQGSDSVIPKTAYAVIKPDEKSFQRLIDLYEIVNALERYKIKYRHYPMSSANGEGWDGIHSKYGHSKTDWIAGLVPEFIVALPRDPRNNNSGSQQYLYKSNGAHYKLIAHSPDDCVTVNNKYPELIDPKRNCWAYGYWTFGAARW